MDHPIARRRASRILGHVTSVDGDLSSPNPHLFPLNCSSTLNSMVPRRDNTLLFARQGSASQGCFMQQVSIKQNSTLSNFSPESADCIYQDSGEPPMFSRQTQKACSSPTSKADQFVRQDSTPSLTEAPNFSRPYSDKCEKEQFFCNRTNQVSLCKGKEWSPRLDVAESRTGYVMTVELPGVSIMDIRVEVDDQKLIVMGKRSTQHWGVANGSENPNLKYLQREILQGPYRVFWSLPNNVNKDMVSAEFVNGFLRITLPKL